MKRIDVDSSILRSVGYDPATQTLEIEFTTRDVRQYVKVPPEVYDMLMASSSLGMFFRRHIKDEYKHFRVQ
jgi:hypothetical protein